MSKKFPTIFNEHFSSAKVLTKVTGILLIGLGLYILSSQPSKTPELGVTFSPRYAKDLGLDPQQTYLQMLEELKVKNIRLPIYWDQIEPTPGQYDFQDLSWYLDQAQTHQAKVILVVGQKAPRWPECFIPTWLEGKSAEEKNLQLLQTVDREVVTFQAHPSLAAWQVENEPLLSYGQCPKPDSNLLQSEVNLVRKLDSNHPILITGSGELSFWVKETELSDWFGTTMYRNVWDKWFGYFNYPLPPVFYQLKYNLAKILAPVNQSNPLMNSKAIVAELQAEPWVPAEKKIFELSVDEQKQIFPASKLSQNLDFAKQTTFSPVYFWGVEWWYLMAKNGDPDYINEAKEIFRTQTK